VPLLLVPLFAGAGLTGRDAGIGTRWWCGVLSLAWIALLGVGIGLPLSFILVATGAAAVVLCVRGIRASGDPPLALPSRATAARGLVLAVGLALPLTAAITHTLYLPPRGDGAVIWFAKARALFEGVPFAHLPFVNYPDLGSTAWMLVLKWTGLAAEPFGRAVLLLGFFAWILAILELFPRPCPWSATIILPVLAAASLDLEGATNGCQDFFLSSVAGVALVFILRISRRGGPASRRDGLLAGFLMASLPLIKQEGTILALILCLGWLIASKKKTIVLLVIPLLLVWPALQMIHGVDPSQIQGDAFTLSSTVNAFRSWDRWPAIVAHFSAVLRDSWPLLCAFVVLAATSALCLPKLRRAVFILVGVLLLHVGFVLFVFLATRQPLEWHLNTAFPRLYGQQRFVVITGLAFMSVELFQAILNRSESVGGVTAAPLLGDVDTAK
jgi:hypothetical protein